VKRHCKFNSLGQMEKFIEGNYRKGGESCVQMIFRIKVVTNMKSRQNKRNDCMLLFMS